MADVSRKGPINSCWSICKPSVRPLVTSFPQNPVISFFSGNLRMIPTQNWKKLVRTDFLEKILFGYYKFMGIVINSR